MRYRKKPIVIEAMPFMAYTDALPGMDLHHWMKSGGCIFELTQKDPGPANLIISTLEGDMRADVGDWIIRLPRSWIDGSDIRGIQGEFYPCKPDIFNATYEPDKE